MNAQIGLKWGKVEVIDLETRIEHQEEWIDKKTGEKKHGGVSQSYVYVTLRCKCGNVFEVEEDTLNKQIHTSCDDCKGKVEEGVRRGEIAPRTGLPGRPLQGRYRKIAMSITVPLDIVDWLQKKADLQYVSISHLVTQTLFKQMQQETGAVESKPEWAE